MDKRKVKKVVVVSKYEQAGKTTLWRNWLARNLRGRSVGLENG